MIIQSHTVVNARDVGRYAWSELKRFHNVRFAYDIHRNIHGLGDRHKKHATKQAEQIRHCLIQAREYAFAAEQVSLSTRPVLMYYSCMSLALAEILMKQTGDSSLDVARKIHNHHGLVLELDESAVRTGQDLKSVASAMRAEPMIRGGNIRAGTFELWHRSARSMPTVGKRTIVHPNLQTTTGSEVLLISRDDRMKELPRNGISLFDCFCLVPGFNDVMRFHGGVDNFVRSSVSRLLYSDGSMRHIHGSPNVNVIIHPTSPALLDQWQNGIVFRSPLCDSIDFQEFGGGGNLKINIEILPFDSLEFLATTNVNDEHLVFWPNQDCLNEFGYIYIGLHIFGNFARYYPDLWMRAVEDSHPIATVAERFLEVAEARMPLATLSELSRSYHVLRS